jgi:hypothetical protein
MNMTVPKSGKRIVGRLWARLRWHTKLIVLIAALAMILRLLGWVGGAFGL